MVVVVPVKVLSSLGKGHGWPALILKGHSKLEHKVLKVYVIYFKRTLNKGSMKLAIANKHKGKF